MDILQRKYIQYYDLIQRYLLKKIVYPQRNSGTTGKFPVKNRQNYLIHLSMLNRFYVKHISFQFGLFVPAQTFLFTVISVSHDMLRRLVRGTVFILYTVI